MSARDWQGEADRLAASALGAGDPTGWFEQLYAAGEGGTVDMPWDRSEANPLLQEWTDGRAGAGRRAIVVGCGLGADAEHVADLGFATTAFDIAPTAVEVARRRRPGSLVEYVVADVLSLPASWERAFDLVVEIYTVQALPDPPRDEAIAAIADLVADGGTLVVIASARDEADPIVRPPPFPLTAREVGAFATGGLRPLASEDVESEGRRHWRATFRR